MVIQWEETAHFSLPVALPPTNSNLIGVVCLAFPWPSWRRLKVIFAGRYDLLNSNQISWGIVGFQDERHGLPPSLKPFEAGYPPYSDEALAKPFSLMNINSFNPTGVVGMGLMSFRLKDPWEDYCALNGKIFSAKTKIWVRIRFFKSFHAGKKCDRISGHDKWIKTENHSRINTYPASWWWVKWFAGLPNDYSLTSIYYAWKGKKKRNNIFSNIL